MNCIVSCVDDYDGPEFFSSNMRKARTTHRCGECLREIKPGERYEHAAGMWDGNFYTHKTCSVCVELREKFCEGYTYENVLGEICEGLSECQNHVTAAAFDGLSIPAGIELATMLDDIWADEDEGDE